MTAFEIPTLETKRLIFRAFREDTDFEPYAAFYATEQTKYYGGPLERSLAWRAAPAMMGHWVIRGFGPWAIEEKATGDFCGMVGLWDPEGWPAREITWSIVTGKQGQGFAYEAAVRAGLALYGLVGSAPVSPGGPTLDATAVAYALVMHWWMNLVQSVTAIYFLIVDRIRPLDVIRRVFGGLDSPPTPAP